MYLEIRNRGGHDLGSMAGRDKQFLDDWDRLLGFIWQLAATNRNPYKELLFEGDPEFARFQAYLVGDRDVYSEQDVPAGERWIVRVPGGPRETTGIVFRQAPRSRLWKYWAREDPNAPGGKGYLFLGAFEKDKDWVFSTDPRDRVSLQGLAQELQSAEVRLYTGAAQNPWYEGTRHNFTIVAAPQGGTRLSDDEVLRIVRKWTQAKPAKTKIASGPAPAIVLNLPYWKWMVAATVLAVVGAGVLVSRPSSTPPPSPGAESVSMSVNGKALERDFIKIIKDDHDGFTYDAQLKMVPQAGENEVVFQDSVPVSQPVKIWVTLESEQKVSIYEPSLQINGGKKQVLAAAPTPENSIKLGPVAAVFSAPEKDGDKNNLVVVHFTYVQEHAVQAPVTVRVQWEPDMQFKRDLYLLAVGVSAYKDKKYDLEVAAKDAADLVKAFQEQQGGLFRSVQVFGGGPLTDEHADKGTVLKGLKWLRDKREPQDLAIVTVAGHGIEERGQFFFLPHDFSTGKELPDAAISWDNFDFYLKGMPCPVLVIMDTCHSGAINLEGRNRGGVDSKKLDLAIKEALANFSKNKIGIALLAACRGDERALEINGHGALTGAILEAMQWQKEFPAQADQLVLTLEDLYGHAKKRVGQTAGRKQAVVADATRGMRLDYIPMSVRRK